MIEDLVYDMVNQQRGAAGIHPVERLWEIDVVARSHSEDMAKRGYFSHVTPEGLTLTDRADRGWYSCALGENLWSMSFGGDMVSAEQLAKIMVDDWMGSSGHRQNILYFGYAHIGIGVVFGDGGSVYATQNFC